MRLRNLLLLCVMTTTALVACSRRFDPETTCGFVQNSELQRVSWNSSTPIKFYVHESMPLDKYPEMEQIIREAANDWNTIVGREVIRIEALHVGGERLPHKDGYSMLYWLDTWEDSARLEQARTTIYWSGSQIYESDIRVNGAYTFYVGDEPSFSGVDFHSLMIHEFGHALGLAHSSAMKSVMAASLASNYDRRKIETPDINSVRCEY